MTTQRLATITHRQPEVAMPNVVHGDVAVQWLSRSSVRNSRAGAPSGRTARELNLQRLVIGGMFSSTALTLLVLPVLYRSIEQRIEKGVSECREQTANSGLGEAVALS